MRGIIGLLMLVACGESNNVPPGADAAKAVECVVSDNTDTGIFPTTIESMKAITDCQPGAMAGLDPDGLWFLRRDIENPFGHSMMRMNNSCEEGFSIEGAEVAAFTDDHIFYSRQGQRGNFTFQVAGLICSKLEGGEFFFQTQTCFIQGEEKECQLRSFDAYPFTVDQSVPSANIDLVGEFKQPNWDTRFIANVRVKGSHAYIAAGEVGLAVLDISDESAPAQIAVLAVPGQEFVNDLKLRSVGGKDYAILASESGLFIADVTNPSQPSFVARTQGGVHTLVLDTVGETTLAYLADGGTPQVNVVDVTDPANPITKGAFDFGRVTNASQLHDLYVENKRAYLNAGDSFVVADIADNPSESAIIGEWVGPQPLYSHSSWVTTVDGKRVAVHGGEGYGAHIRTIDVEPDSPTFMQVLGSYKLQDEVSAHNVMAFGNKAYIAYYQYGVRVLDLSDPTNLKELGHFHTWDAQTSLATSFEGAAGIDIDLEKGRIYVADYPRGMLILDDKTSQPSAN